MHQSHLGRTMLETIMVIGLMGVLSVVGIYLYRQAMDGVRADGIIKDVLVRASQAKGNADLGRSGIGKKTVYTPDYKKASGEDKTKGRYGYEFKVVYSNFNSSDKNYYVVVKTSGNSITPKVCNALKSKLLSYKNNSKGEVTCMTNADPSGNSKNCTSLTCPENDSENFYFVAKYKE